jgi:hypothetical protein
VGRMIKVFSIAVLLTLVPVLLFCGPGLIANRGPQTGWSAIQWPFPVDAWPQGRAFRCGVEECGMEVDFYIRPKIGFCDCYRGVADDDEIDRVGDMVVLGQNYAPTAPGAAATLGGLQGRTRAFVVDAQNRTKLYAVGIALHHKCDAIVATVVSDKPISGRAEDSAFRLLNSPEMKNWIEAIPQS